jgi:hypothetical protein
MPKTSSRPIIRIHDISTDEVIDREMTDAEFTAYQANQAAEAIKEEAKSKAEAEKASLLARLGLTEHELKTILG